VVEGPGLGVGDGAGGMRVARLENPRMKDEG
jgi:hypothetical protein